MTHTRTNVSYIGEARRPDGFSSNRLWVEYTSENGTFREELYPMTTRHIKTWAPYFDWGSYTMGSCQTALAILFDATDGDSMVAGGCARQFAMEYLSNGTGNFKLSRDAVLAWLEPKEEAL